MSRLSNAALQSILTGLRKTLLKRFALEMLRKRFALEKRVNVIGLSGVWFVSLGSPPPMYTPSPESPDQLMTCVKGACDVGHRGPEALQ